jgi:hypothetical protein
MRMAGEAKTRRVRRHPIAGRPTLGAGKSDFRKEAEA